MKIDSGTLTEITEEDLGPDGSFVIPAGVTTIGDSAFHGCIGLTTVTIRDEVTIIGDDAFYYCIRLTGLVIPDSVATIGDSAFYECRGLTTVTIPNGVITIDDNAFYKCCRLTSLTISDSVAMIGEGAFADCDILKNIYVSETQQGGLEKIRGLLPTYLRDKVTAVQPAGRLTKRASASSAVAGPGSAEGSGLFDASEQALSLATLLQETKKQISTPGQVQLIFITMSEARAVQSELEHAGIHAGASAAVQYAIEEISKTDENEETASAASAAASDSSSSYTINITQAEYNQFMQDPSAYDKLSQSAKDLQSHRP